MKPVVPAPILVIVFFLSALSVSAGESEKVAPSLQKRVGSSKAALKNAKSSRAIEVKTIGSSGDGEIPGNRPQLSPESESRIGLEVKVPLKVHRHADQK